MPTRECCLPPNLRSSWPLASAGGVYTGLGRVLAAEISTRFQPGPPSNWDSRGALIGADPRNRPSHELPSSICVAEYAPYSALFSRAALIVHQGGVGTTRNASAQASR